MPSKCFASWAPRNWTRPLRRRDTNRSCSDQPQNPPPYLLGVTGHNVKHALVSPERPADSPRLEILPARRPLLWRTRVKYREKSAGKQRPDSAWSTSCQITQRFEIGIPMVDRFHPLISSLAGPGAAVAAYSISIARVSPGNKET